MRRLSRPPVSALVCVGGGRLRQVEEVEGLASLAGGRIGQSVL